MKFTKFGRTLLVSALSAGVLLGVTSCVKSYTVGFLYVTGLVTAQPNGAGILSGFKIDHNTGKLIPINGLPISSGGANPVRAVLLNGSRFLYVLNRGVNASGGSECTTADPCHNSNITQFTVGANGILTPQLTFFTQGINPERLIADTTGSFLFVMDHDAPGADGKTPSSASNPSATCALALGKGVTTCGDITVFQVSAATGRLSLVLNAQVSQAGGEPLTYFPVPANPIDVNLTSGFVLTLSGNSSTGDVSFPYAYNPNNGQLTVGQNAAQQLNIKAGTAIVSAAGTIFVLDNEPISANGTVVSQSQIVAYSVGNNGTLQPIVAGNIPDDSAQSNPIELLVESKGKFLYVANQGNNNTQSGNAESGITGYDIDPNSQYVEIGGQQFGTGSGPQCLVEDPSDQFIYTANFNDSTVTGKLLNVETGTLAPLSKGSSFALNGPATWCLMDGRTN